MKNKKMYFEIDDFVMVGNKKIKLNLNVYRNLHYQINNKAKIIFKEKLLNNYPALALIKSDFIRVNYDIIPNNKQKFDTMNIVSIVDKFFLDTLVNIGCIPDDDYTHVSYGYITTSKIVKNKNKKIRIFCDFYEKNS